MNKFRWKNFKDFWDCQEYDCTEERRRDLQGVRRTAIVIVGGISSTIVFMAIYILVVTK